MRLILGVLDGIIHCYNILQSVKIFLQFELQAYFADVPHTLRNILKNIIKGMRGVARKFLVGGSKSSQMLVTMVDRRGKFGFRNG